MCSSWNCSWDYSTILSQHSDVFVVGDIGWALVLSGDDDGGEGLWNTLWACVNHIQNGPRLCSGVDSMLLTLAMFVSPDLCLCFLDQDECHAGDPWTPRCVWWGEASRRSCCSVCHRAVFEPEEPHCSSRPLLPGLRSLTLPAQILSSSDQRVSPLPCLSPPAVLFDLVQCSKNLSSRRRLLIGSGLAWHSWHPGF